MIDELAHRDPRQAAIVKLRFQEAHAKMKQLEASHGESKETLPVLALAQIGAGRLAEARVNVRTCELLGTMNGNDVYGRLAREAKALLAKSAGAQQGNER